jgi:hypothetical protein
MLNLTVKEHPMFFSLLREYTAVVADRPVTDETHSVSYQCSFNGCASTIHATPSARLGLTGLCGDRRYQYKPYIIYIGVNDHSEEEIGVPDMTLFVVPAGASVVLRCMALGLSVSQDRTIHAARLLPPLAGEGEDVSSTGDLLKRITRKADEIRRQVPQHFILNDNLWPR